MTRDESWLRETLATAQTPTHDPRQQLDNIHALARHRRRRHVIATTVVATVAAVGAVTLTSNLTDRQSDSGPADNSSSCAYTSPETDAAAAAAALEVNPRTVVSGEAVTIRTKSGGPRISPDLVTVRGEAPACLAYRLDSGGLIEFETGGLSIGISNFKGQVSFDIPTDVPPGTYQVCSLVETDTSFKDVCGQVSVEPR